MQFHGVLPPVQAQVEVVVQVLLARHGLLVEHVAERGRHGLRLGEILASDQDIGVALGPAGQFREARPERGALDQHDGDVLPCQGGAQLPGLAVALEVARGILEAASAETGEELVSGPIYKGHGSWTRQAREKVALDAGLDDRTEGCPRIVPRQVALHRRSEDPERHEPPASGSQARENTGVIAYSSMDARISAAVSGSRSRSRGRRRTSTGVCSSSRVNLSRRSRPSSRSRNPPP